MVDLSTVANEPYPAALLVFGGAVALLLGAYGRRDDSLLDEVGTAVAFVLGAAIAVVCAAVLMEDTLDSYSVAVLVLLALCLFLRPLKGIPWAIVFGLAAGAVAAYVASLLLPSDVLGVEEWKILLVLFLVVGGIAWFLTRIIGGLLSISSTVMSWRASTIIIGLVALAEGVSLLLAGSSLMSLA